MSQDNPPERRTALVTGASAGLGAEFARQLAQRGYDLILVARRTELMQALAEEIQKRLPVQVQVVSADLSKSEAVFQLEELISQTPALEILVNNAGFGMHGRFLDVPLERHTEMLEVHVVASLRLARAALPGMLQRRQAAIINVSSVAAFFPFGSVTYPATKSFLVSFSEALQQELRHSAIRVQALCPGFFRSEFHDTRAYKERGFKRERIPAWLWLTTEYVVEQSLEALERRGVICIPSRRYQLISAIIRTRLTRGFIKTVAGLLIDKYR
jgi:hypothetical protein